MASMIILATMAEVSPSSPYFEVRKIEYNFALHRLESYKLPMYLIVSETNHVKQLTMESMRNKYTQIFTISDTAKLGAHNKSQQETFSIQSWFHSVSNIPENCWVVKVSGRYLLIDDTFMETVKNVPDQVVCVAQETPDKTQIRTFCFAMRFGLYRKFSTEYAPRHLGNRCVENCIHDFLVSEKQISNCVFLERLGILTNIANENMFRVF
jgi:hypothetical protein